MSWWTGPETTCCPEDSVCAVCCSHPATPQERWWYLRSGVAYGARKVLNWMSWNIPFLPRTVYVLSFGKDGAKTKIKGAYRSFGKAVIAGLEDEDHDDCWMSIKDQQVR